MVSVARMKTLHPLGLDVYDLGPVTLVKIVRKRFIFLGGHTTFCGFLNAFIHVLMYTYYFLAAFGPEVSR